MAHSKGAYRVGTDFNPNNDPIVNGIKERAADLIDFIERIPSNHGTTISAAATQQAEIARLKSLAQTEVESAAMWAVKAATKRQPEQ